MQLRPKVRDSTVLYKMAPEKEKEEESSSQQLEPQTSSSRITNGQDGIGKQITGNFTFKFNSACAREIMY